MEFKKFTYKDKAGFVGFKVLQTFKYSSSFVRVNLQNDGKGINLFVEGLKEVLFFTRVKVGTWLYFDSVLVSRDFSVLWRNLQDCINYESIAFANSEFDFILEFFFDSSFYVEFEKNEMLVVKGTSLEKVDLRTIYGEDLQEVHDLSCLRRIRENNKKSFVTSFIGVLLDCSGSYIKKDSRDRICIYKITDPSIYPDFATINIFHKYSDQIPKLKNLGDILYFHKISLEVSSGKLRGTISSSSKDSSFSAHDYRDSKRAPYACFIEPVIINEDTIKEINQMKTWVKDSLSSSISEYLNLITLTDAQIISGEVDLIGRILSIGTLGVSISDPLVIHLQHNNKLIQILIPKVRKKLLTHINPGDTIRIRSIFNSFGGFVISDYTEILRIQFEDVIIKHNSSLNEVLDKFESATGKKVSYLGVSAIPKNSLRYPKVSIWDLEKFPDNSVFRLRVFLVCLWIRQPELQMELWDGKIEDSVKAFVAEKDILGFLNGFGLDKVNKSERLVVEAFRCLVKIVDGRFQIFETKLVGF